MRQRGKDVRWVLDTPAAALRYYPVKRIVHHEFKQFVRGELFRSVLEKGLETFVKHRACKWLSDDRGNTAITPADTEWALQDWAPRVIAAGWKYWAVVMPENVIGQMNMKRWIKTYADRGVTAQAFTQPGEAMLWLEQQGVPSADSR
ncbi:MAG: hypothetical protein M3O46_01760 [Myxococcota bacterium]|nr:hypothetical protein [Myxococcota bacterium]